jgi:hypothetical protein
VGEELRKGVKDYSSSRDFPLQQQRQQHNYEELPLQQRQKKIFAAAAATCVTLRRQDSSTLNRFVLKFAVLRAKSKRTA